MHQQTQEYLDAVATPVICPMSECTAAVTALQRTAARYSAQLALEGAEIQQALMAETVPALLPLVNNACQRTQFLLSRLDKISTVLMEVRTGLVDLAADQMALRSPTA